MKRIHVILGTICCLALIVSCSKNQQGNSTVSQQQEPVGAGVPEKTFVRKDGVSLYPGTPLYQENDEGKMVYATEVVKGEVISVCYDEATDQIEEKEAVRRLSSGQEDTMNFVMVSFDGMDYWTRDIFVARDVGGVGTVVEEVYIYSSPENIGITSEKISAGDMLAVNLEQVPQNNFMEVTIYNGTPYGRQVYLQSDSLVTRVGDVTAIRTTSRLKELAGNPDAKLKLEVLEQVTALCKDMEISLAVWNYLFSEEL